MDPLSIVSLSSDLASERTQQAMTVAVARKLQQVQALKASQAAALIEGRVPRARLPGETGQLFDLEA